MFSLYTSIVTWADFTIVDFTGFDLPPLADANGPYNGVVGGAVAFDGTTSKDLDGTIVTYDWDFGDGAGSGESTPSQTYAEAGIYAATLTVTDDSGATDSDNTIAIIQPSEPG